MARMVLIIPLRHCGWGFPSAQFWLLVKRIRSDTCWKGLIGGFVFCPLGPNVPRNTRIAMRNSMAFKVGRAHQIKWLHEFLPYEVAYKKCLPQPLLVTSCGHFSCHGPTPNHSAGQFHMIHRRWRWFFILLDESSSEPDPEPNGSSDCHG